MFFNQNTCNTFVTALYPFSFPCSCIAAGCIISPTGATQSTLNRRASLPAAAETTPNAHRKPWVTSRRLRQRCTRRWIKFVFRNKVVFSRLPKCVCRKLQGRSINLVFLCCVGLLHTGDRCDGVQPGNHRRDLFWDRVLPGKHTLFFQILCHGARGALQVARGTIVPMMCRVFLTSSFELWWFSESGDV